MPSAFEWYVFGVVVLFASLFVLAGYYDGKATGYARQRWGTPIEWTALATVVGVAIAGLFGLFGTVPPSAAGRRGVVVMAVHAAPLVLGCIAVAVGANHWRTYVRLRRAAETATGDVTEEQAGTQLAVEGTVTADEPGTSAALGCLGVCWSWRFYIRGMYGQDDENPRWLSRKGGAGGVPFYLDDGSGPVAVSPEEARIDLLGERTEIRNADVAQPGRVGRNLRSSIGGEEYRYVESIATEGRRLVALGTVTDDGAIEAERIVDPGIEGANRRYARRGAAFAFGGAVGILAGVRLLSGYFGTTLPV
jgi:hypothetical protein